MHVGKVHPDKERRVGLAVALDEINGFIGDLVVDRFHPLARQRTRILDLLFADTAEARVFGGVVLGGGEAVQDAARTEGLVELREFFLGRVVRVFRIFLGVQVIEVAEELIEAWTVGR
jgi:hypothetical protein